MSVRDLGPNQDPVLCYVSGPWAYFTTKKLEEQTGDDWDDAPYEHNAGPPYRPCWHRREGRGSPGQGLCDCDPCKRDWDGETPRWRIIKVAWDGVLEEPDAWATNTPWSVDMINAGAEPWLRTARFAAGVVHHVRIAAGTTLSEFRRLVAMADGHVYESIEHLRDLVRAIRDTNRLEGGR